MTNPEFIELCPISERRWSLKSENSIQIFIMSTEAQNDFGIDYFLMNTNTVNSPWLLIKTAKTGYVHLVMN